MLKTSTTYQKKYIRFLEKAIAKGNQQIIKDFLKTFDVQLVYLTFPFDIDFYKKKRELKKHIDRNTPGYNIAIGYIEYITWGETDSPSDSFFQVVYTICSPADQFSKRIAQENIVAFFTDRHPNSFRFEFNIATTEIRKKIQASVIDHILQNSEAPSKFRRLLKKYRKEGLL